MIMGFISKIVNSDRDKNLESGRTGLRCKMEPKALSPLWLFLNMVAFRATYGLCLLAKFSNEISCNIVKTQENFVTQSIKPNMSNGSRLSIQNIGIFWFLVGGVLIFECICTVTFFTRYMNGTTILNLNGDK